MGTVQETVGRPWAERVECPSQVKSRNDRDAEWDLKKPDRNVGGGEPNGLYATHVLSAEPAAEKAALAENEDLPRIVCSEGLVP